MSLLFKDLPIEFSASLAVKIGINEAIFLQNLQTIHWQSAATFERDGRKWVCRTISEWAEIYPFWSERTIKSIIKSLREKDLIFVGQLGPAFDRTNYYSVNREALAEIWG